MIIIPQEFAHPLIRILEWHLETYMPELIFDGRVERILDELRKVEARKIDVCIEKNDIYYIHVCASNATNNVDACGIDKDLVWKIHDWAFTEHKKSK